MQNEFIDGITVLSESVFVATWLEALLAAIIIALVMGCIIAGLKENWRYGAFIGIITLILVFCVAYIPNREPKITYKVLIDESVSMRDFDKLYEVIGHEGEIILIKVKEQEE